MEGIFSTKFPNYDKKIYLKSGLFREKINHKGSLQKLKGRYSTLMGKIF